MIMDIQRVGLYRIGALVITLLLFCFPKESSAQYFVSPVGSIKKWSQIDTESYKLVFPENNSYTGAMTATYLNELLLYINRGFLNPIKKFPILLRTDNILSNGLVTWVPKRMEIYSVPSRNTFATQWMKQLVTHEFRHVAQMSNIDVGFTNVMSYIIGEQAQGIVAMTLPTYFLEGDATLIETLYSTFGRGRQPKFSIDYRAILHTKTSIYRKRNKDKLNIDKMLLGSYKDHVPNIYHTGYYLVGASNRYYGGDFWGKVLDYTGRRPYTIVPVSFAFNKYAKENMNTLASRTLNELNSHWKQYSYIPNSSTILNTKKTSYTTYTDPLPFNDSLVLVLKADFDKTNRFTVINSNTNIEQRLLYTGYVTSRPIIKDNIVYWTEYDPSLSWGQKNSSVVKSMTLSLNKRGKVKYKKHKTKKITEQGVFYVSAMGDDGFAMISYNEDNLPELVIVDTQFNIIEKHLYRKFDSSFNGLTWDNKTKTIYGIILDEQGMWIGGFNRRKKAFEEVTRPSYVTVNNLSATDGRLFFTSIMSGKDEVHSLLLDDKSEHKITLSQYGSVSSSLGSIWSQRTVNDSTMLMTTYSVKGYLPAKQTIEKEFAEKINYSYIPNDLLSYKYDSLANLRIAEQPIINMDSVKIDSSVVKKFKVKKYRKGLNFFNVHSWAPIYLDVDKLMNEQQITIGAGAFFTSQNLLSDVIFGGGIGYYNKSFTYSANASYTGLPVHFSASVDGGGGDQLLQSTKEISGSSSAERQDLNKFLSFSGKLSLPLNFTSGVNLRFFELSAGYSYINTVLEDIDSYIEGIHKMNLSVKFSNYKSRTAKQLAPRLGYIFELYSAINPVKSDFGRVYGVFLKGFFPGLMKNHTLQISALYQHQDEGEFNYLQKGSFALGAFNNFAAKNVLSAKMLYKAPIAYPDWGFASSVYFRRITLTLLADYSYAAPTAQYASRFKTRNFYTYGGGLDFELNIFRISYPVIVGFTMYKTNTDDKLGWFLNFRIIL